MADAVRTPTPDQRRVLRRLANGWELFRWYGRHRFARDGRYYGWLDADAEHDLRAAGWIWHGAITDAGRAVLGPVPRQEDTTS